MSKETETEEKNDIVEQVEEAVEAVEEALEEKDTARADKILRQIEQWQSNQSSTLEKAILSALNPLLEQVKEMRQELTNLKAPTKEREQTPQAPLKAPSTEEAPTPPTDTSPMDGRESAARVDQEQAPQAEQSERKKRRWI